MDRDTKQRTSVPYKGAKKKQARASFLKRKIKDVHAGLVEIETLLRDTRERIFGYEIRLQKARDHVYSRIDPQFAGEAAVMMEDIRQDIQLLITDRDAMEVYAIKAAETLMDLESELMEIQLDLKQ